MFLVEETPVILDDASKRGTPVRRRYRVWIVMAALTLLGTMALLLSNMVSVLPSASAGALSLVPHSLVPRSLWSRRVSNSFRRNTFTDYACTAATSVLKKSSKTRYYTFTVTQVTTQPDGYERVMTLINGQFPGPLIEANAYDTLIITVVNQGVEPTSLHLHGLFQEGEGYYDGPVGNTQCAIPVGESFTYKVKLHGQYGTFWYHSHYLTQYNDGVVGPLVIHGTEETSLMNQYDFDQVIMVQDYYHTESSVLLGQYIVQGKINFPPVPDNALINGAGYYNCSGEDVDGTCTQSEAKRNVLYFKKGATYRLRVINVGALSSIEFSVDNHKLTIVEGDAVLTDHYEVDSLHVAVAQRYSVLLTTDQTNADAFWMRANIDTSCLPPSASTNWNPNGTAVVVYKKYYSIIEQLLGLTHILSASITADTSYTGSATGTLNFGGCEVMDDSMLTPSISDDPGEPDFMYEVDVSFAINGTDFFSAYINGTQYISPAQATLYQTIMMYRDADTEDTNSTILSNHTGVLPTGTYNGDPNQFVINFPERGKTADILIMNKAGGLHPFHLHGHVFSVRGMGASGTWDYSMLDTLPTTNLMRRDTVMVPGWTLIRVYFNNPGLWSFHCHIAWHLEDGMYMQWLVDADSISTWSPPQAWFDLCPS
ncbi:Cupredoxin [Myxozyma melibiosi]|uniref:Cupredoxin n=1 Tax=Myxozyma melibiosi TaxID=54550 RepID=A0ABR1EYF5_9ASCO